MEIDEVRMTLAGRRLGAERSAHISQLTLDHVSRLVDDRLCQLTETRDLNFLGVGPIDVRFDFMDDETIARESALQIYRAILQAL